MPRGPNPTPITLTDDEQAKLADWARRPTSAQRLALRAHTALAAADGRGNAAIATEPRATVPTGRGWRDRFADRRLEGLADEPRPGTPRTTTDARVEAAVTRTLEAKPTDATHRSARTLARDLSLSQTAAVRIWHAFGLRPHRRGSFKLSADPFFVEKVRGVAGSTWPRRTGRPCCAWTGRARSRPSTAPSRPSPCSPAAQRRARTTTSGTAPPRCSPPRAGRRGG